MPDTPRAEGESGRPSDWERRRRLAEVFGEVLPESTSDDRDPDGSSATEDTGTDAWLRAQVPPHHG